jgi:hypothetical protein
MEVDLEDVDIADAATAALDPSARLTATDSEKEVTSDVANVDQALDDLSDPLDLDDAAT